MSTRTSRHEATNSYWIESAAMPEFSKLDRDLTVDVGIVGGGLTGITSAYLLKRAGLRVALLERGKLAEVDTGLTTAHLTAVTDLRLTALARAFGRDHAQAAWDAGFAAISQIDECVRTEDIDCGFEWVKGYLHTPAVGDSSDSAQDELQADADLAGSLGFDAEHVDRVPFFNRPGIEFDGQARFHPRKYLAALARSIDGGGSYIFEHTAADEIVDEPASIRAGEHTIRCDRVIVATHNPIVGKASLLSATLLQTKLSLYSSYVVGGRVPSGIVPDALFWDTADPYRYLRVEPAGTFDYVILGGEDHKTGQHDDTRDCFAELEKVLRKLVPEVEIQHRWSGQVIETNDGLPLVGEMTRGQFAATGFAGNGMTFGTLAAMMACDWTLARANPWSKLFDIKRTKVIGGLWDYLKENKDYPYYLIRDRFAGADSRSLRTVRRGTGQIVDLARTRVAAYRGPDGSVTLLSPVCTHMGCHVRWNTAERTWDCPCHGSRFSPDGRVLSGPAETPLEDVHVAAT
jgi:glycine/D-amino acid oxidase-like deaminating enzyme/nitrite reductase/ring-hydroxylating ferredoxin subunit